VYILGVRRVVVTAACRALAGTVILGVILVSAEAAGYRQMATYVSIDGGWWGRPPTYVVATPWWGYAVPVVGGLLGLALAIRIYRVAPRAIDRHLLIRRTTTSSSL
jgi:hypothetical protein